MSSQFDGLDTQTVTPIIRLGAHASTHLEPMQLHADLNQRAVLDTHTLAWTPSPVAGVERRLLDRAGGEVAPAAGCAIRTAACTAPGARPAAPSGSRPGTCQLRLGPTA